VVAYFLDAFLGEREPVLGLDRALAGCRVVELAQGVFMIPFNKAMRGAAAARQHDPQADPEWPFGNIDSDCARRLVDLAGPGKIAYVEAEFFGGVGDQSSIGWLNGRLCLGPIRALEAINEAARFLGVHASGGHDEFDTLGLGKHRDTERW
jgi:hypothetical protein